MAFPSTFLDVQNAVVAKARLDSTADLSKVKDWINQVYADVCVTTEANVTSATMTLTASTNSYTLPSNVSRIKEMYVTPVGGVQSLPLVQVDLDFILRRRQSTAGVAFTNGSVMWYALVGLNDFEVYPTPANADVITIYYVALPTALANNTDVPILPEPYASKLLEYGALAEAADFKSDPQEQEYRALYERWLQKFRAHLTRKQGMQPGQFRVIPDVSTWPPHDPSTDIREWR